jgi:hypothetical protein
MEDQEHYHEWILRKLREEREANESLQSISKEK